ncbi:LysR family transcriptional regulator [Streptomyces sp. NBC_01431]|uniref:LysR family transcriptional regulator n=1 Tax=Streptomyces sp. NBC_01431 TaxID=2903863 RepID=UPI002E33EFB7|nr:LysR family transcriptional regulator [Streptomyces sp. NBC_01431]
MDLLLHLRYFRTVAEEQHFGRAAERLRVAQPSLSQRIQRLERELGVRLFDRGRTGATLTPAGRLVLAETDPLLDAADRLRTLVGRVQGGAAGTLRAAVPPQLGGATIAALLTAYRDRSPGGELDLRELSTAEQTAELTAGTLDAGIVRHPCPATGLGFGPQLHQPLGALIADDDPLAQHPEIDVRQLNGRELVLFPRASAPALHDETLTACTRHGCTPTAVREVAGLEFTRALVLSGTHVTALLPKPPPEPGTTWRPLHANPLTWRTSTAWPAGRDGPAVRLFTEAAHDVLRDHAGLIPTAPGRRLFPRPASEFPL